MQESIKGILNQVNFDVHDIIQLLEADDINTEYLFSQAAKIKQKHIGNYTYFRGLIELSNYCRKDCYYCGLRKSNSDVFRYDVRDEEILKSVAYAYERNWGSIVIQSGERQDIEFAKRIERLLIKINKQTNFELGITLSLGEQDYDTYKRWYEAGATRYLLRIESSNKELYNKIHPNDSFHKYENRIKSLETLQRIGYITGTGVMIGLPFQDLKDLANDLLFMKSLDIDMCGMGPYIEHETTPLYKYKNTLLPLSERYTLSLKMIAILRIMMLDINIASTTALQVINPNGREEALLVGANVIMPNITPTLYHANYNIYKGKPEIEPETDTYIQKLEQTIKQAGDTIGYGQKGDPKHFFNKKQ